MPPDPRNAPGDFYVENGCCTLCGVPWHYAPRLFVRSRRQWVLGVAPAGDPAEHGHMMEVIEIQELGCVKYRGRDPQIIEVVRKSGG